MRIYYFICYCMFICTIVYERLCLPCFKPPLDGSADTLETLTYSLASVSFTSADGKLLSKKIGLLLFVEWKPTLLFSFNCQRRPIEVHC